MAVVVDVVAPGQYVEVQFLADLTIEIDRSAALPRGLRELATLPLPP